MGGDTIWANTVTAYESLPAELRDLTDRLRIVHTNDHDYAAVYSRGERDDAALQARRKEFVSTVYETEHPAVRVHPETSERSLVLGGFARTVTGFSPQASRDLIRILQDYVTHPEQTVRWRWRVGDLAIWDSRATQHYAIFDYGTEHRRGERVTVAGRCRSASTAARVSRSRARRARTTRAWRTEAAPGQAIIPRQTDHKGRPMSASADIHRPDRKPVPVYKRKRQRTYGGLTVTGIAVIAISIWVLTQGSSGTAIPGFTIAYGQGTVANSDSIIASEPSLAKTIPAHVHFVPFDAGVTAIAEMRSGSLQAISGVGNPPVVGAIGTHTGVNVVIAQSFDADALIVPKPIHTAAQLAGKSVGVLVGSSEDYELRGWLGLEHLTSSVKVVGFASEQAAAAAYLGGSVAAAYVQAGPEAQLIAKGGHPLIDAEQIARLGIPGLNVVAVADNLVRSDPALVQKYVCAEVQATRQFTGPQADKYLAQSAKVQGVPGNLIVPATKGYPFIPLSQQLHWLGSAPGDTSSPIVRAYVQTGRFLVGQGRLPSAPSAAVIAAHVDPTFVKKALAGDC